MAEKIHPSNGYQYYQDDPSFSEYSMKPQPPQSKSPLLPPPPKFSSAPPQKPLSIPPPPQANDETSVHQPSGTYVIHFPKEQILSYPPPENSAKYESLSRRKPRRRCCCSCICYTILLLFILAIIAAVAAGILYLVFRPVALNYDLSNVSIRGMNLTSSAPLSPVFDLSIKAENPNKKLGIYYLSGSEVDVSYDGVPLGNGVIPEFFQPAKNVTNLKISLKESDVILGGSVISAMKKGVSQKKVALHVNVKVPIKLKAGSVKTWTMKFKVKCDVSVDSIDEKSRILSKSCEYKLKLW